MPKTQTKNKTKKRVTTAGVIAKPSREVPVQLREVPVQLRELTGDETLVLGFRQNMLEIKNHGGVDTGTGLGSDFILLRWRDRQALVRGSELLRAWVATFAPKDAKRFPK